MQPGNKVSCTETSGRDKRGRTSNAIPGMSMTTISAWKNFRLAFRPIAGMLCSAASMNSDAAIDMLALLGKDGMGGKLRPAELGDAIRATSSETEGMGSGAGVDGGDSNMLGIGDSVVMCRNFRLRDSRRFHPAILKRTRTAQ